MKYIIILSILLYSNLYGFEKYMLPCNRDLLERSLSIAIKESGTVEKSNRNDGPVLKYLKAVGISYQAPYCAAGQYWSFLKAAEELGIPESVIPIKKTASVRIMYNHAKSAGKRARFTIDTYDLLVWRIPNSSRGHIERVAAKKAKGNIICIGFNTTKFINGKRFEGVFLRKRNYLHPLGRLLFKGVIGFREAA